MVQIPARRAPGWTTLQVTFAALAGALLLTFLLPLLSFLPDVDRSELARQVERAGLARSLAVSAASATVATALTALGGVPLGYLLARDRLRLPWLVRTLVLVPLVLPPVAAGVLLLNVYGPGGMVGGILERAGWTVANALGGIVIAQVFITAPFVVLTAEAAFRAVDSRLEAVAATLGRTPGEIFRKISLPLARYGLLAGLALAWMRAAGEFGATVVLAYHPRSLPVHLWVELTGRGLRAALPVALVALALAAVLLLLAQRFEAHRQGTRPVTRLRGPAREAPGAIATEAASAPGLPPIEGPLIEARFSLRLGGFRLAVDLDARQEILSLFGPSGAGKSTLLKVIAGLIDPDTGRLKLAGETVFGDGGSVPPEERSVGFVLQEPSLFPHLSVRGNVTFAADGADSAGRFERLLAVTRLDGLEDRYPSELSGGQQQRVALARALMQRPRILLLDEPFSSLDTNMRERLHEDVKRVQAAFGLCVVYVTHELRDACVMGDRMAVIGDGRIEQVGDPLEVIRHPATFDVARFVGVRNLFKGTVREAAGGRALVDAAGLALEASGGAEVGAATRVYVCVRPEDILVSPAARERADIGCNSILVTLCSRQLRGSTYTLVVETSASPSGLRLEIELPVRSCERLGLRERDPFMVTVPPEAVHLIPVDGPGSDPATSLECDDEPPPSRLNGGTESYIDRHGEGRAFGREQRSEQDFAGRSETRSPGDAEIVSAVLDGRQDQYAVLVRRYQDVLFRYAERMTGRPDEAEDIVQLTFVRGYRSLASCRNPDRVGGWLFRIAANLCKDQVKGRRRRERPLDEVSELQVDEPSPHASAERDEIRRRIDGALERLPVEQREAFVLKHVEGWSYQEMSERLEVSVPALKMRVHRAREELQRLLEQYYTE